MKKYITIFFFSIIAVILTSCSGGEDKAATTTENSEMFTITAENWKLSSDRELVVHRGDNVKIDLKVKDGYHGIALDEYDVNLLGDSSTEFIADKTGEFTIYCSVVCGSNQQHTGMNMTLKVID